MLREIQTIKNRIQDEMPEVAQVLSKAQIEAMLQGYNNQMLVEMSTAIGRNQARLEALDFQERTQEMAAISRMTREIYQNQVLQEIRAKYQPISESLEA